MEVISRASTFRLPQQHQGLQQQGASIDPSMAQSLRDLSAPPVFQVAPLQANHNLLENLVPFNELGVTAVHDQVGGDYGLNLSKPRKRSREEEEEEEEMVASASANSDLLMGDRQHVLLSPPSNPPSRSAAFPAFYFSKKNPNSDLMGMHEDVLELDLFISSQLEKVTAWSIGVRTLEDRVQRLLRAKDEEIASVARRNSAVEERLHMLALEGQMWKTLARTSEVAVGALRRDLELAQQAAAAGRGGLPWDGAGEVADSVSRCEGRRRDGEERGSPGRCRVCGRGEASRVLLPCRHLCLCGECDPATGSCPLCGCHKGASIKVYLS